MRSLQSIRADEDSGLDGAAAKSQLLLPTAERHSGWQSIIDPNSPYKMLYSLQILNTLVSVNN